MEQQLIISVGREFGSGGHEIAKRISDKYKLPIYDHQLLDELAEQTNLNNDELKAINDEISNYMIEGDLRRDPCTGRDLASADGA